MGRLIPQESIEAFRQFNNLSVENFGIDCQLFVVNDTTRMEPNDVYSKVTDATYCASQTQVFIDWRPDHKMLRKFGLFTEGELPIICWFKNNPDVVLGSYIKIDMQYVPKNFDRDEFEIVDVLIRGIYDAIVLNAYKLAPRRVKTMIGDGK